MASRELAPAAVADLTADFAATTICLTAPGLVMPGPDFLASCFDAVPLLGPGLPEADLFGTVVALALIVGVDLLVAPALGLAADLAVVLALPVAEVAADVVLVPPLVDEDPPVAVLDLAAVPPVVRDRAPDAAVLLVAVALVPVALVPVALVPVDLVPVDLDVADLPVVDLPAVDPVPVDLDVADLPVVDLPAADRVPVDRVEADLPAADLVAAPVVPLAVVVLDLVAVVDVGFIAVMALAASAIALAASAIALVALVMAVVMVVMAFAVEDALVAIDFIVLAADVALVAAEETFVAAAVAVGAVLLVAVPDLVLLVADDAAVVFLATDLFGAVFLATLLLAGVAFAFSRLADVLLAAALFVRPAVPRLEAVRDAVLVATDLPPVMISYGGIYFQVPNNLHTRPQMPIGCQTVLVSRNVVIRSVPGSADHSVGPGRSTLLRLSAAALSHSTASSCGAPARSMALTSRCDASHGVSSARRPVRMFTTPPGRSEVASTSARVMAGSGAGSDATTTAVLPDTIAGAITETRPSSAESGATMATTPVGSGEEKLKNGPDTGLAAPATAPILSAQPAYQTQRSMASSTSVVAAALVAPPSLSSAMNCPLRPSSISAIR
ncbi:MAG: hypothetical protein QOE54_2950 [Streptosporangiaceae bacterium]|nr:hypothetical protein [Streptosporangiaceae bacterium]